MKQAHRFSGVNGTPQPYFGLTKLRAKGGPVWTGEARFIQEALDQPLRWRAPRKIFVNSMSDLFHEDLTNEQIAAVFGVMAACQQHTFQVLTKRAERMRAWFDWIAREKFLRDNPSPNFIVALHAQCFNRMPCWTVPTGQKWPLPNVWLGVSVESQKYADERIPLLLKTPAAVRWVSAEPLLEGVDLSRYLPGEGYERNAAGEMVRRVGPCLDWVVVGGESGPGARPFCLSWAMNIVADCEESGTPVFVKQLGAHPYRVAHDVEELDIYHPDDVGTWLSLKDRKGGDLEEWPSYLRKREFPREARAQ